VSDLNQIGLTGLAVMGANLARNIARNGYSIAVHNRTPAKTRDFVAEFGGEGAITGTETIEEFVAALERPRKIIIMVKAARRARCSARASCPAATVAHGPRSRKS
jgi:6-phosphogluconate dehydrogenase